MIAIYHGQSAWGGEIIISREFFNKRTGDYVHIEAHQIKNNPDMGLDGTFAVAIWCNDGNDGGKEFDGELNHVVKKMQEYVPDAGFVEMAIPKDAYC